MENRAVIRVMLVDDSAIIRGLVSRALKEADDIEIVGAATDGQQAINLVAGYNPDVIVLDIEMPVMDGLTALPELLKRAPKAHIIMASTLTERNAEISLRALSLGASDYLAKPSAREQDATEAFFRDLIDKIRTLGRSPAHRYLAAAATAVKPVTVAPVIKETPSYLQPVKRVEAIAIASSTGGPQALQSFFTQLKNRASRVPIFITQHMPPTFTTILAEHLGRASGLPSHEAKDGQKVEAGHIYLAPGDFHMQPERVGSDVIIRLNQLPPENFCRPAADPMLRNLSHIYRNTLFTIVFTGMGQDGMLGAKEVVAGGGEVIAQDQETSVVWGMPRAVTEAKLVTNVLPLELIADHVARAVQR